MLKKYIQTDQRIVHIQLLLLYNMLPFVQESIDLGIASYGQGRNVESGTFPGYQCNLLDSYPMATSKFELGKLELGNYFTLKVEVRDLNPLQS
jgi:hypothetical protein